MSQPDHRDENGDDKPLDPAAERIQAKLKKLLLGSSLIMVLGFIAVFAAIIYRINNQQAGSGDDFAATIAVGADASVLQATLADGVLLVLVREGAGTALLRIDPQSGRHLGRTDFVAR